MCQFLTLGEQLSFLLKDNFPLRRSVKYLDGYFDVVREADSLCVNLTVFWIGNLNSPGKMWPRAFFPGQFGPFLGLDRNPPFVGN